MERRWPTLPEELVLLIFDFLGYPYPPRIGTMARCKHYYKRQCISIREVTQYCFDKYSAAVIIFALCLGLVIGEAISHI